MVTLPAAALFGQRASSCIVCFLSLWRCIGTSVMLLSVLTAVGCSVLFESSSDTQVNADRCDPDACEAIGGICTLAEECSLSCEGDTCACPEGLNCLITVPGSYNSDIDCSLATKCTVLCGGEDGSCQGSIILCGEDCDVMCVGEYACSGGFGVLCGIGDCNVSCLEKGSCWGVGVSCRQAETCDLQCGGSACDGADFNCQQAQACSASCLTSSSCDGASLRCTVPERCDFECAPEIDAVCSDGSL